MKIKNILMSQIVIDEEQPRKNVDKARIGVLSSSILKQGLIYPIEVVKIGGNTYKIIDGERRYRAFQLLKRKKIQCIIKEKNEVPFDDILLRQSITDFHKEKLNIVEQSELVERLSKKYGVKQIIHLLGIGSTKYYILKKINKLNDNTKQKIIDGKLKPTVIHYLSNYDLRPDKEDSIIKEIIKRKRRTKEQIHRLIMTRQNFRWIVNKHLSDTYIYKKKIDDFIIFLRKNDNLILDEIDELLKTGNKELRKSLNNLVTESLSIIKIIDKRMKNDTEVRKTHE